MSKISVVRAGRTNFLKGYSKMGDQMGLELNRRALFFDLDGTLLDSIPALYVNYCEFLARYGCRGTQEEFKFVNGPALPEIIKHLQQAHNIPGTDEEITADYDAGLVRNYRDVVGPREGAHEMLTDLTGRGYSLFLVTSTHEPLVMNILKRLEMESYFSGIITGERVARAKPEPDIYLYALNEAQAAADLTVAVEDSPNGTRSAAAAGCITVSLAIETPEELLRNAGAQYLIHSLAELPPLLKKIHSGSDNV